MKRSGRVGMVLGLGWGLISLGTLIVGTTILPTYFATAERRIIQNQLNHLAHIATSDPDHFEREVESWGPSDSSESGSTNSSRQGSRPPLTASLYELDLSSAPISLRRLSEVTGSGDFDESFNSNAQSSHLGNPNSSNDSNSLSNFLPTLSVDEWKEIYVQLAQIQQNNPDQLPTLLKQVSPSLYQGYALVDHNLGQSATLLQMQATGSVRFIGQLVAYGSAGIILLLVISGGTLLIWIDKQESFYRTIFDDTQEAAFLVDAQTQQILKVNAAFERLLGYSESEASQLTLKTIMAEKANRSDQQRNTFIQGVLLKEEDYIGEQCYFHKNKSLIYVEVSSSSLILDQRSILCLVAHDITTRKRAEIQLRHNATHDNLTGLPNRAWFMAKLKKAFYLMQKQRTLMAVLFLDLDGFKVVNDSLGHTAGDELLVTIGHKLSNSLYPGEILARFGGDEFVVLLEYIYENQDAIQVADRLIQTFRPPIQLRGQLIHISASIGIAFRDGLMIQAHGEDRPEQILRDADIAMYWAKSRGRSQYAVFDQNMHDQAIWRLKMENELRQALDQNELDVFYQPIIQLATGSVIGFEALVRWNHPQDGFISPGEFIPLAEETGLVIPLDWWVLEQVCHQLRSWRQHLPPSTFVSVSVNLSGQQFSKPGLADRIAQLISDLNLEPKMIKLEITESLITEDDNTVTSTLLQLREFGVQLSIDDFGIGYSSLSRLHNYPINTLKIDRAFISRMGPNGENSEMVRMIISLAHSLGLDVIAEGIETEEQLKVISSMRCEFGQGYFFSRPLEKTLAEAYLIKHVESYSLQSL